MDPASAFALVMQNRAMLTAPSAPPQPLSSLSSSSSSSSSSRTHQHQHQHHGRPPLPPATWHAPPAPHHYQHQPQQQHYGAGFQPQPAYGSASYYATLPPPHPAIYAMPITQYYGTQQGPPPPMLPQPQSQPQYPLQPPHAYSSMHDSSHRPNQRTKQNKRVPTHAPPVDAAAAAAAAVAADSQVMYCASCDKEITGLANFNAHCATHEMCRHPGCSFSGTKKVVMAHFHRAHGQFSGSGYKMIEVEGGQKFRVLLGTTPEEVEKWRAERRNRFPTPENVAKKEAQQEELRSAGGVVAQQQRGKKRSRQGSDANGTDGGGGDGDGDGGGADEPARKAATGPRKKPCAFFARGKCTAGEACKFSHDFEPRVCAFFVRNGRCTRGARCTFLHDKAARDSKLASDREATGGSSSSRQVEGGEGSESGSGVGMAAGADSSHEAGVQPRATASIGDSCNSGGGGGGGGGGGRRDEKRRERTDDELRAAASRKKGALFLPKPLAGGTRGTLLKKLLQPEVEEEENIILQCLRLIVESNFLAGF